MSRFRAHTLMVVGMDESWPAVSPYCTMDGAGCYVTASKTKHQYPCSKCHVVIDFLVKRGDLCAVCIRQQRLADGHRYCTGKPCYDKHIQHLTIQEAQCINHIQQPVNSRSVIAPVVSDLQPGPHPSPLHQPSGRQDESRSPGAFTVSHTSQAALTGPVVLAPRQLFPPPMQPPQMHQQGDHLITILRLMLMELDAAKQELNRVASSIEQVYNQICSLTGSAHGTVQPSHSSVHPVAIHAPEQR